LHGPAVTLARRVNADAGRGIIVDVVVRLKGAPALKALEEAGRLFATPGEVAAVLDRDIKSVYLGLERGQIPSIRVGPRYQISVAWLRKQASSTPDPQPVRAAS
jgi:hypothetical protein